MRRLFNIEFGKLRGYRTFWALSILYLLLMGVVLIYLDSFHFGMNGSRKQGMQVNFGSMGIFVFSGIWHNITYVAGFFKIFLAVIVVILVSGEYEYRTIRQNIIDGLSRSEYFTSKMITIFLISFCAMMYVLVIIIILGFVHTNDITFDKITEHSEFILAFFLEMFGYLTFVFLVTNLVKKAAFAVGIYFVYTLLVEPLLAFKFDTVASYMPLQSFGNLIHMPFARYIGQNVPEFVAFKDVAISFFYIGLFSFLNWWLIEKRDL